MRVGQDPEIERLLKSVVDTFYNEDMSVRERQLRKYRRLKLYWDSFSQVYYSETARDFRIFNQENVDNDQEYYDRPVNVFRAFLETIIAALSVTVPAVQCSPDDAEDPLDISTAKAGDKISELIYKHNDVIQVWLHSLYIFMTEGMIACRLCTDKDEKYGNRKVPEYRDETIEAYLCPNCGIRLGDELFSNKERDEFAPDEDDVLVGDKLKQGNLCPECLFELDPALQKSPLIIPRLVGYTHEPKSSIKLKVYGGLYVKVANYAQKQCDTPYLIYSYETNFVNVMEEYPHVKDIPRSGSIKDPYEQFARLNTQYRGEYPTNTVTVRESWLRPAAFNCLTSEESERLHKEFPNGVCVVLADDVLCDYYPEALDDVWTLTENPLSDYLTHDPLGELLVNIQDITNDLISLTLQTIEHGIAQTWADPAVVNFEAYKQIEAAPGTITPTKNVPSSKNVSDAFFTSHTAALSPEVFNFYRIVQELGQFVSGAFPSLFGGNLSGSRTASEYAMSRDQALQRLQTPWKMMTVWWKQIFGKAIPAFMKLMQEDYRMVEKNDQGNFINVFIRLSEIQGSIGNIELNAADQLPITPAQKKDMIMQLMQLNNMAIQEALMAPENLPFLRDVAQISELKIPGEEDRQKQYEEINQLINSQPIPGVSEAEMAMGAEPMELPSIPVDPLVDNHAIESAICRSWLIGPAGRLAKMENPLGYQNILLHYQQHLMLAQQQMMEQQIQEEPVKDTGTPEKIKEEEDVSTPIG